MGGLVGYSQQRKNMENAIEFLATVTLGEVFDPADMPEEIAAMENAPEGWNDAIPGLEEMTR